MLVRNKAGPKMLSDKERWAKVVHVAKKKIVPGFPVFQKGRFTQNFLAEKKNKTGQAYSLGLKMTIVLLPKKNNFDELYR
jgi:hypothetical protein